MKYISLFSGIEAASVAWEPLGWVPAVFCEIEKFPSAVLAHHYPNVPNLGDVTKADFDAIGHVDLIVFGSPCQSFSIAGKRLGLDDPRGNLALLAGTVVYRKRPDWFIFENVPGLLSSDSGWDFGTLLAAFAGYPPGSVFEPPAGGWKNSGTVRGAANGYGLAWRVLDAQYVRVDGFGRAVPQRRRRVFVVGNSRDWRRAAAVLFERESLSWDSAPRREAGERASAAVAPCLRAGGNTTGGDRPYGTDVDTCDSLIASTGNVAHCLNAGAMGRIDYETETMIAHALRGEGFDASEDGTGRGTPLVPIAFACKAGANTGLAIGDLPGALRGEGHGGGHAAVAYGLSTQQEPKWADDLSPTLTVPSKSGGGQPTAVAFDTYNQTVLPDGTTQTLCSRGDTPGGNAHLVPAIQHGWAVRRLTPRECERLQGFPDGYTDVPWRGKDHAPDGPRYKALGNSMAVNVMRWLGTRIESVSNIEKEAAWPEA